jgi:hypothetical protein
MKRRDFLKVFGLSAVAPVAFAHTTPNKYSPSLSKGDVFIFESETHGFEYFATRKEHPEFQAIGCNCFKKVKEGWVNCTDRTRTWKKSQG